MSSRPDPFRRDPGAPFDSLEREQYAQARAKGGSIKAACAAAGISGETGTKFERHPEIRKRISELRQGAETYVGVSKAWVLQQLQRNAEEARDSGAFKASNEALISIYKIISEDRGVGHDMARALPPNVTPQELQKRLKESFKAPRLTAGRERIEQPAFDSEPDAAEAEAETLQ